jgi:uncharacterized alpha/beta hydrolase family protein
MHIRKQTKKVIIIIVIIIIIIIIIAIPITQIYNNSNSNSIQFFIIYVPSQQPQGQLQAQHSVDKIIIT